MNYMKASLEYDTELLASLPHIPRELDNMQEQTIFSDGDICIRPFTAADVLALFEATRESISELCRWMVWCHPNYSLQDCLGFVSKSRADWEEGTQYSFGVFSNNRGTLLGSVGLSTINRTHKCANLGYWVRTGLTGHGIGAKACRLMSQFAFEELELNRLELLIPNQNRFSLKVADRIGATVEGLLRNRLMLNGRAHDAFMYSLVAKGSNQGAMRNALTI